MIHARTTMLFAFFVIFLMPQLSNASNIVWSENFDNYICTSGQTCAIAKPPIGSAWIQKDVSSYPGDPYGINYTYASPGTNGTGKYLRGAANVAPFWTWKYDAAWPSDELYASFYHKIDGYVKTSTNENFKIWRPTFRDGMGGYATIEVIFTVPPNGIDINYYNQGGSIRDSGNVKMPSISIVDGKWRHFEFYINFKTKVLKMWYEGQLAYTNETKYPGGDSGWTITNNPYWLNAGNIDGQTAGTFTRSIDNVEFWDGMPSGDRSYIPPNIPNEPNAPMNLKIN